MKIHRWVEIEREQMNPLFARRVLHTERMSVAAVELGKGAIVPWHSHPNEQVTVLQKGRLRFDFEGAHYVIEAGQLLEIPGGAPHRVEALEDSMALDLFAPPREDWIRGDDVYLRK